MLKEKIKMPLWVMTILYALAFLDGAFTLGFSDSLYAILGFGLIAALIWAWVILSKYES